MPDLPPIEDSLRTLGSRIGLTPGSQVLCLLLTSGGQLFEDLVPTVYRLHTLAQMTGATVWVRCFDSEVRGELRTLDELAQALRAVDPGDGHRDDDGNGSRWEALLPGMGGDDPARALTQAFAQHATLPNGQAVDRLLLVIDGWSGALVPPWKPSAQPLPTVALITQRAAAGLFDEERRIAHLRPRLPWGTLAPESLLATLVAQHELQQALATVAAEAPNPVAATARARPRL